MSDFQTAVSVLLDHEGGLACVELDHGGLTKYGISSRSYPDLDIATLTEDDAIAIYERDYWQPIWTQIHSQALATKLLVMSVNMGLHWGTALLQRAVNDAGGDLKEDGRFGPKTLAAVNALDESTLLLELRARGILFYVDIILRDPSQREWAHGWIRRQLA